MTEPTPDTDTDTDTDTEPAAQSVPAVGIAAETKYQDDGTLPDAPSYLSTAPEPGPDVTS